MGVNTQPPFLPGPIAAQSLTCLRIIPSIRVPWTRIQMWVGSTSMLGWCHSPTLAGPARDECVHPIPALDHQHSCWEVVLRVDLGNSRSNHMPQSLGVAFCRPEASASELLSQGAAAVERRHKAASWGCWASPWTILGSAHSSVTFLSTTKWYVTGVFKKNVFFRLCKKNVLRQNAVCHRCM